MCVLEKNSFPFFLISLVGFSLFRISFGRSFLRNVTARRTPPMFGALLPNSIFVAFSAFFVTVTTSRRVRSRQAPSVTYTTVQLTWSFFLDSNEIRTGVSRADTWAVEAAPASGEAYLLAPVGVTQQEKYDCCEFRKKRKHFDRR